ncbi:E4 ORFF [Tree shrew adenovirus 1]|uniref:E4 ORFF n=1 Tax=Tree shrew adenovirus serotype 1 TaxID=47680 RepID=A0A2U9AG98_ADET1|nr:E4 ORFF [Tree shrew adenovirus 1]
MEPITCPPLHCSEQDCICWLAEAINKIVIALRYLPFGSWHQCHALLTLYDRFREVFEKHRRVSWEKTFFLFQKYNQVRALLQQYEQNSD